MYRKSKLSLTFDLKEKHMKNRGIVMSRKGMVSSAHTLISSTGVKILNRGGNAMDACIAMANTSSVVLPDMCGFGGDAFLLYYDAKTKEVTAINGSGAAPRKASIDVFKKLGHETIPNDGMLSVSVPGAVDAYFEGLRLFGTMKFEDLVEDAIDLARNGCPVSEKVHRHMKTDYDKLMRYPSSKSVYLKGDNPYQVGELIYYPELADTIELVAKEGRDVFYKGILAEKIVKHSELNGGLLSLEDFVEHKSVVTKPIKVNYRDYIINQSPPVSQGIIHLEEMSILNQFDLKSMSKAERIHHMVEAKKIAFMDRNRYFGDPDFNSNPIEELLSNEYAKKCADIIRENGDSTIDIQDSLYFDELGHTTSMIAVDRWGNACSFIHSVSATWGSCEIVEGTGILLNNRAGSGFNLIDGHPNAIQAGKKTMHTLNTYLVTDGFGNLKYVGNTPGGDNQPQWNMQVLVNVIDLKMDPQEAVEEPKWSDIQSSNPYGRNIVNTLNIEETVGVEVMDELKKYGHIIKPLSRLQASGASQFIEIKSNGVLFGGSDPRADGCAIGEV